MKKIFAPGCALIIYKPHLAEKLHKILSENIESMERLDICCRNKPTLEVNTQVINICPGCDRRYRENYENSSTVSLWEVLAESDFFPFPDYKGMKMSIIDACPTRSQERVHKAVRDLLKRMNIELIEPAPFAWAKPCINSLNIKLSTMLQGHICRKLQSMERKYISITRMHLCIPN